MIDTLKNTALFVDKAYSDGKWLDAYSRKTFTVTNPATGEVVGAVPDMGGAETRDAITAAATAFKTWKNTAATERARLLKKWHALMLENADDLARILTLEQGKPLREARGEILYGASFVEWFAEEACRVYGDVIPGPDRDTRIVVIKQPIGVVGAITPWNFPNAMITRKIAPAIAAGCTVVIKPAKRTPFSALAIAKLAEAAGFPPGVVNVITGSSASEIGNELTGNPIVKKISFTGSTQTGKLLMKQSADTVKKVSLELGGNAPFIVFDDADIGLAVQGAIASKYRNAGQTCVCANRIYVQSGIIEAFTEQYTAAVKALNVGNGLEDDIDIGPLIDEQAMNSVKMLVNDALGSGATLVTGGKPHSSDDLFYEPTVLCHVTPEMRIAHEEIFGPVSAIFGFDSEEEVIEQANDTPYGLASYFYGTNINRIWRVAEALEYGIVGVNTGSISTTVAPFGGIKESGFGKEGSKYGIEEYVITKYINFKL